MQQQDPFLTDLQSFKTSKQNKFNYKDQKTFWETWIQRAHEKGRLSALLPFLTSTYITRPFLRVHVWETLINKESLPKQSLLPYITQENFPNPHMRSMLKTKIQTLSTKTQGRQSKKPTTTIRKQHIFGGGGGGGETVRSQRVNTGSGANRLCVGGGGVLDASEIVSRTLDIHSEPESYPHIADDTIKMYSKPSLDVYFTRRRKINQRSIMDEISKTINGLNQIFQLYQLLNRVDVEIQLKKKMEQNKRQLETKRKTLEQIRENFEHNMAVYALGAQNVLAELVKIVESFRPGSTFVSVGSGTARIESQLKEKCPNYEYIMIDPAPDSYMPSGSQIKLYPDYPSVQEFIKKKGTIKASILFLNWVDPELDYDTVAVEKLEPEKIVVIWEENRCAGGVRFGDKLGNFDGYVRENLMRKVLFNNTVGTKYFSMDVYTRSSVSQDQGGGKGGGVSQTKQRKSSRGGGAP